MVSARVTPMSEAEFSAWRASRIAAGHPLPELGEDDGSEAVRVVVGDVAVGGAVLTYDQRDGPRRCTLRTLETTLAQDGTGAWSGALAAIEAHVRARGAQALVTAVSPDLAGLYDRAGYRATMTTVSKRMDPDSVHELQEDQRVTLRPMNPDERRQYAQDAVVLVRAGMARAGVAGTETALDDLTDRIAGLAGDSVSEDELLLVGLLDGQPIGRLWATLVTSEDGATDFIGNLVDLFPEHRGQGLTPSFLGALRRHLDTLAVRDVQGRLYAHDASARRTVVGEGAGIDDVHLRKDLA